MLQYGLIVYSSLVTKTVDLPFSLNSKKFITAKNPQFDHFLSIQALMDNFP